MDAGAVATKSKEDLGQLLDVLDEKSRAILWHLWWHRHAQISELRDSIDSPSDFDVLHRLKDVINTKAQQLWGKPIVSFEQSKSDPVDGEKVLFSWWFLGEEDIPLPAENKPLVDVFNDGDSVTVIAKVPTAIDPAHADIQFKNGILKVKIKKEDKAGGNRAESNHEKHEKGVRIKVKCKA